MRPRGVVVVNVAPKPSAGLRDAGTAAQISLLVFRCAAFRFIVGQSRSTNTLSGNIRHRLPHALSPERRRDRQVSVASARQRSRRAAFRSSLQEVTMTTAFTFAAIGCGTRPPSVRRCGGASVRLVDQQRAVGLHPGPLTARSAVFARDQRRRPRGPRHGLGGHSGPVNSRNTPPCERAFRRLQLVTEKCRPSERSQGPGCLRCRLGHSSRNGRITRLMKGQPCKVASHSGRQGQGHTLAEKSVCFGQKEGTRIGIHSARVARFVIRKEGGLFSVGRGPTFED